MVRIGLLGLLLLLVGQALAGSLSLDRTVLNLTSQNPVAELTLSNVGTAPALVQTNVFSWSQQDNENRLEPTADLLVSPPIVEIPSGASQILRVGLLAAADPAVETPYRVIIQEVPRATEKDDEVTVSVLLRASLPVFVRPGTKADPQLQWQATRRSANGITISLSNWGNAHAKVVDLDVYENDATPLVESETFLAYVLPGQTRSWNFATSPTWSGSRIKISAETSQGRVHADLELEGG